MTEATPPAVVFRTVSTRPAPGRHQATLRRMRP
jgi:hypothetical protein